MMSWPCGGKLHNTSIGEIKWKKRRLLSLLFNPISLTIQSLRIGGIDRLHSWIRVLDFRFRFFGGLLFFTGNVTVRTLFYSTEVNSGNTILHLWPVWFESHHLTASPQGVIWCNTANVGNMRHRFYNLLDDISLQEPRLLCAKLSYSTLNFGSPILVHKFVFLNNWPLSLLYKSCVFVRMYIHLFSLLWFSECTFTVTVVNLFYSFCRKKELFYIFPAYMLVSCNLTLSCFY